MPVRILHIVTYMGRGGLETLLMNCMRHIDRERVQFDFLVHREFRGDYDDEIEALGGRIYRIPRLNPFHPGYYKALERFFQSHREYRIVHCHLDCMSALPLAAAKKAGVPVRIAHAHSSNQDHDWKYALKLVFKSFIPQYTTDYFACSSEAGNWMFPNVDSHVIKNGIDPSVFHYDPSRRLQVRTHLQLQQKLVLGHTGRFSPVKNHSFLLDIFAEVHRRRPDSVLMLIGTGELESDIRRKAAALGLSDAVLFLGSRDNVSDYLQAMDVFLLPSLYEGFGIAGLEAQCCGLPCFFSDQVPHTCGIADTVTFLPLTLSARQWAERILQADISHRTSRHQAIRDAGFDIAQTANILLSYYLHV